MGVAIDMIPKEQSSEMCSIQWIETQLCKKVVLSGLKALAYANNVMFEMV